MTAGTGRRTPPTTSAPAPPARPWLTLTVVACAQLMVALDGVPVVRAEKSTDMADLC
jgi:hypothetical protein